jgi:RNA polymerase-binding protein DksA
MTDLSAAKSRLESQLAELEERQAHIARDLDAPASADSEERAVEQEDDDALEGQAALVTREISSVKRALLRIEQGEYGICVRCGGDISEGRLEARPEAALCIACASQEG